jgi:hypothetical protein
MTKKQQTSKMNELTFQLIENSVVVLARNGAYTQHEAYIRRGEVFVRVGSFYVGLLRQGTSKSGYNVIDYDLGGQEEYAYTPTGRLVLKQHADANEACARYRLAPRPV